jgi:hypothetical protein
LTDFDAAMFDDSLGMFVAGLPDGTNYFAMVGSPLHMRGAEHFTAAVESVSGEPFLLAVKVDVVNLGPPQRSFFGRNDTFVRDLPEVVKSFETPAGIVY